MAQHDTPRNKWGRVPVQVASDSRLTTRDFRVLIAIATFADKHGRCWPSRKRIAERANLAIPHVSNSTTRLVSFGYLLKEGSGGRGRACRYQLVYPVNGTAAGTLLDPINGTGRDEGFEAPREPKNGTAAGTPSEQTSTKRKNPAKGEICLGDGNCPAEWRHVGVGHA